jgi:hypothetical protein
MTVVITSLALKGEEGGENVSKEIVKIIGFWHLSQLGSLKEPDYI